MKILITLLFVAAGACGLMSGYGILSSASLLPAIFCAAALAVMMLHLINRSDRRY